MGDKGGENPAVLGAAVFLLSAKNRRGVFKHPPGRAKVKQPLNPFGVPFLDLFDLEFNLEDDLVGPNEFDFRNQRPSIHLISLGYFEASRYSMLETNLNTTLTSRT